MTVDTQLVTPAPTAEAEQGRRRAGPLPRPPRLPRLERVPRPKPTPRQMLISYAFSLLALLLACVLVNLIVISQFQHWTAQRKLYGELRLALAQGSSPVGQIDGSGHLVALGTPVALLQIPKLGISEVVVEGTTSTQTKAAVGHSRDTPLPGQAGVSVLMGRQAAYGGVFGDIGQLRAGDQIVITTGEGVARYRVIGPRLEKERLPGLTGNQGRLILQTASGIPFLPSGTLTVDADLVSKAFQTPAVAIAPGGATASEQPMAGDTTGVVALSWLMELLVLLAVGAVFAWKLWDRRAAWIVAFPLILVTSLACADKICSLLPNLI